MVEYRRSPHAVTDLKYHVIWVTKYRYKILRGDIAERARDLLRQICVAREVTIIRGAVSPDHIHMLVAAPPQLSPSKLVQFMKGRSSRLLQREFPALRKRYWGQHLWHGATIARVLARSTKKRSASISRINDGKRRAMDSRSPRRPSLLSRRGKPGSFRRLQPQPDFQSTRNLPPLAARG